MSLKMGKWKMNLNGIETDLILESLDPENLLTGQITNLGPPISIHGFWDDTARSISFVPWTIPGAGGVPLPIHFRGFLFSTPPTPEPGQDVVWTLAGFYQTAGTDPMPRITGHARRNTFGWFAQITEVS